MPIRQGGVLASRASTWPRDHFCRSTMAPRLSRPMTWKEFLPISMPATAIAVFEFRRHSVLLVFGAPCQRNLLAGQEHGRTIPLADSRLHRNVTAALYSTLMLAAWITLAHFSVSSAMSFPKSAGEPGITVPPRSTNRAFILALARPALLSLLIVSMT